MTAPAAFAELAEQLPATHVVWLLRRGQVGDTFGGGDADQLPARGALGHRAAAAVEAGHISTVTGFGTAAVDQDGDGPLVLASMDGRRLDPVDEVVAVTALGPDLSWLSEARLNLHPILQAPRASAR